MRKSGDKIKNRVVYTLILRIRTLYIIEKLIKNKKYSKKEFVKLIKKISGNNSAYDSYLSIKNDSGKEDMTTKEESERLCNYLEKNLDYVKNELILFKQKH